MKITKSKIILDEKSLRERLYSIAEEVGDEKVKKAAREGCLNSIVTRVTKSPKFNEIIEKFFQDFPDSHLIIKTLQAYQGLEGVIEVVAEAIGKTAYRTENPKAVKRVAETLQAYQGLEGVIEVAEAIGKTAYWTENPEAVKRVAETLQAYQGLEGVIEVVAKAIGKTAYWTKNPKAVKRVAEDFLSRLK